MTDVQQKAQIDTAITNKTNPASITPTTVGNEMKSLVDFTKQEVTTRPVNSGLVANSSLETTTTILSYDVNVLSTATSTDYACKLPQPVTGKTVKLINNSSRVILLFPSNSGGKIGNGLIDQPVQIPNDGKVYEFICIVNPNPGIWAFTNPPIIKTITIAEIYIDHINGTVSNKTGVTQANLTTEAGLSLDANKNIILTGEWKSEDVPTTLSKIKCETNIVDADLFDEQGPSGINSEIMTGYKYLHQVSPVIYGTTFSSRHSFRWTKPTYYLGLKATVGTLNVPPAIGDTDTQYNEESAFTILQDEQLGTGGDYSRYFYSFAYNIPANAATKRYKFRWTIDVIQ